MPEYPEIETTETKLVYQSPWMSVREDIVRLADGSPGFFNVVESRNGVVIIAKDNQGRLLLVQQYRYALKCRTWEFPMGGMSGAGDETAIDVARRELSEETGRTASRLQPLGKVITAGVVMDQYFEVFFATGLSDGQPKVEPSEIGLVARLVSVDEIEAMIKAGTIRDAQSLSAFTMARLQGLI